MARFSAREFGRLDTTYTSELGKLTWEWVMKADGRVLYRLSHIDGRPERNAWRELYRLSPTERWEIESDTAKAADLLARLARDRGHHLDGNHN